MKASPACGEDNSGAMVVVTHDMTMMVTVMMVTPGAYENPIFRVDL